LSATRAVGTKILMGRWQRFRDWSGWPRADKWLYRYRSFFTTLFLLVILLELIALAAALSRISWWPSSFRVLTITNQVELLLATGTLALAFAAIVQIGSAERKREADLRPHLDLQVIQSPRGPLLWDTFVLSEDSSILFLRLRNLGPGNAVRVRLLGYNWLVDTSKENPHLTELMTGGPSRGPLIDPPALFPMMVIGEPIALAANETFEVHYQYRVPPLSDVVKDRPPEPSASYCEQILFIASCEDVERVAREEVRVGLRAQLLVPAKTEEGKELRNYLSVWRKLNSTETHSIPVLAPSESHKKAR